jgi:hypothetical protein
MYFLIAFSGYVSDSETVYKVGNYMVFLVIGNVIVNFSSIFVFQISGVIKKFKNKKRRRK